VVDAKILTTETTEETDDAEDGAGEELGSSFTGENTPYTVRDPLTRQPRKYYFDGGQVEIVAELVHELDPDGKQLRVVRLTDYTAEKVRSLCANSEDLRARWADLDQRAAMIDALQDRGIDFPSLALQAGKPDADPFDLLCHLAFNAPLLTRRQRAERVRRDGNGFFAQFAPEAREILTELLEKYAADGELQFTLPDVLKLPPISQHGNVNEIIRKFGGSESLRFAVAELQKILYVA
jgi:type I restriction enzyme R subunit